MVNYGNAKIYKMVNEVDDKIYVGSTCSTLSKRKGQHRANVSKLLNNTFYKHCNLVGWDNVKIVLIEALECKNKDELCRRERYWIDELKPVLNSKMPIRAPEETQAYRKAWWLAHPEKREESKAQMKLKRVKTPEEIEQRQLLKEQRALARKQKAKEVLTCACGKTHRRSGKSVHMKSIIHTNFFI